MGIYRLVSAGAFADCISTPSSQGHIPLLKQAAACDITGQAGELIPVFRLVDEARDVSLSPTPSLLRAALHGDPCNYSPDGTVDCTVGWSWVEMEPLAGNGKPAPSLLPQVLSRVGSSFKPLLKPRKPIEGSPHLQQHREIEKCCHKL